MNKKIKFSVILLIATFMGQMLFSQIQINIPNPLDIAKKALDSRPKIRDNYAALPTGAKIAIYNITKINGPIDLSKPSELFNDSNKMIPIVTFLSIEQANAKYYENAELFLKAMKAKLIEYKPEDVIGKTDLPKSMKDVLDESDGKININYCASLILDRYYNFSDEETMKALEILLKYNKQTEESETLFGEGVTPIPSFQEYQQPSFNYINFYYFGKENHHSTSKNADGQSAPQKGSNKFVSESILTYAINNNNDDIVNYVVENGGWKNIHNFIYLIENGKYDLAKLCLDKGLNVNSVYRSLYGSYFSRNLTNPSYELAINPANATPKGFPLVNMPPLHYFIGKGNLDAVKWLVENGASIKAGTVELEVKTGSGNKVVAKMKKFKVADPYTLATKNKKDDIAAYLSSQGAGAKKK